MDQVQIDPDLDGLGRHEDVDAPRSRRIEEPRFVLSRTFQIPGAHAPHPQSAVQPLLVESPRNLNRAIHAVENAAHRPGAVGDELASVLNSRMHLRNDLLAIGPGHPLIGGPHGRLHITSGFRGPHARGQPWVGCQGVPGDADDVRRIA